MAFGKKPTTNEEKQVSKDKQKWYEEIIRKGGIPHVPKPKKPKERNSARLGYAGRVPTRKKSLTA